MFLVTGATILIKAMSLSLPDVIYACKIAVSSAVVSGGLGYLIGKIFENSLNKDKKKSKKASRIKIAELGIDELLIEDLNKVNEELESLK